MGGFGRGIWAELLELPTSDISTDESFFNLGGHSILLSRMLLRLREEFGRSISINRFIELPTIIKLATLVRGTDRFGHFEPEPRPTADFSAEGLAVQKQLRERRMSILMRPTRAA